MTLLTKICESLGKKNEPVYTVVAIALFKGIFRPLFTMMDKKQDPKSKKYAAIREGSTELIAIPTYIGLSYLTQKFAPAFAVDKNIVKTLESTKRTLGFFGVCFAALIAIPGLCNIAMPHILKAFNKKNSNKEIVLKYFPTETIFKSKSLNKNFEKMQIQKPKETYFRMNIKNTGGMKV